MAEEKKNIPKLRFREFTGDNANAWELRKLGLLASFTKGNGYSKKDLVQDSNQTPIILYGSLYTNYKTNIEKVDTFARVKDKTIYSSGNDVVVPASGESAEDISRASAILKKGIILGGDLNIIHPLPDLNAIFLAITISNGTQKRELSRRAQGKSVVHLRNQDLKQVNLLYPNLEEQQKIGSFFKHLDELITLHQRMLDEYKTLKKTMLSKIFPKNGEKYPELRFFGFTDAWEQRKLGEIVEWSKGSGLSKDALNIQGIGVPVIHYADLYKFNSVQKEVIHWTMNDIGTKIPENNLLFPMSDVTPDGLARTSTVLQSNVKAGGDVLIAKLNKDILSTFMSYQINRNKNQILPLVTGTTVRHINSKSLSTLKVTVPGKNEQKYVGSILMRFDSLIALHQRELELLKTLKKTMLQQMFV